MNLLKNLFLPLAAAASMAAPTLAAPSPEIHGGSGSDAIGALGSAEAFAWRRFATHYDAQCFANYIRRCGGCIYSIYFDGCGWVVTYA
ncbi:MAG: hypothetical protein AAF196_03285 [Planctomycetota bacterium]